jgi:hypothetical protein
MQHSDTWAIYIPARWAAATSPAISSTIPRAAVRSRLPTPFRRAKSGEELSRKWQSTAEGWWQPVSSPASWQ